MKYVGWSLFAAALALGLWARIAGLGLAPIAIDEYYLSRSIDGILEHGIPTWDCGGYYQRGLLLQYVIAGLRELGATAELGPRLVAVVGSLAVLPALYLLGRRIVGLPSALIVVAIVAVSLWQVELARFGRFYAPFQAVFAWYLIYFLRVCVDGDRRAWRPLIALTVVGAFVWEGAIFLGAANFIPLLVDFSRTGRVQMRDLRLAGLLAALLAGIYAMIAAPARYWSEIPALPEDFSPAAIAPTSPYVIELAQFAHAAFLTHPLWLLALLPPLILFVLSLLRLHAAAAPRILLLGTSVAALAALGGHFAMAAAVLILLPLLRPAGSAVPPRTSLLLFAAATVFCLVTWLSYAWHANGWPALVAQAGSPLRAAAALLYPLLQFPDVIAEILRPFAVTAPRLGLLIAFALAILWIDEVRTPDASRRPRGALLLVALMLMLAVGASGPPRHETRYLAFLYPALLLLTVAAGVQVARWVRPRGSLAPLAGALLAILAFTVTEDWNPRHLVRIATPEGLFRVGMSPEMQAHLGEARDDFRGIANWLSTNVDPARDRVFNAVHGVDYYYREFSHLYVPGDSSNFRDWACLRGTVDRWSELPLVTDPQQLAAHAATVRYLYLVTWDLDVPSLQASLPSLSLDVVAREGATVILRLGAPR